MAHSYDRGSHDHKDGHSHSHGSGHSHGAGASAQRLVVALCLTGAFLIAEVVGGLMFKSLALLSDAAHMFTDVTALVIALLAICIGARAADERRTFGYRRLEILAAAVNAVLLFGVAIFVLIEGVRRIYEPAEVQSVGMLVIAVVGLAANLVAMRVLADGKDESLNVRGAYLEVWADMIGSVGVIAAALIIRFTGWAWVDPIVAIGIGLWVLPRTWILLRDTTNILLEGTPRGMALSEIRAALLAVDGIAGIHELHVWISGADQTTCTVHVVLAENTDAETVRRAVTTILKEKYGIEHATVQTEQEVCAETHAHP
jgi:cobalt-zinc-cadmium efflux system protein